MDAKVACFGYHHIGPGPRGPALRLEENCVATISYVATLGKRKQSDDGLRDV